MYKPLCASSPVIIKVVGSLDGAGLPRFAVLVVIPFIEQAAIVNTTIAAKKNIVFFKTHSL
jgi:hypothetical protein